MKNIVYDNQFNGNEWFVIGVSVIGFASIWLFPKRYSPLQTTFNILIGVAFGLVFDHTLKIPPLELYDLGDQSKYQLMDFFSYMMYAPFGYWFIYLYEQMRMFKIKTIVYILCWAAVAVGLEWLGVQVGVYHYKHGYKLIYSFPIYLFLMSIHILLYRLAFAQNRRQINSNRPVFNKK